MTTLGQLNTMHKMDQASSVAVALTPVALTMRFERLGKRKTRPGTLRSQAMKVIAKSQICHPPDGTSLWNYFKPDEYTIISKGGLAMKELTIKRGQQQRRKDRPKSTSKSTSKSTPECAVEVAEARCNLPQRLSSGIWLLRMAYRLKTVDIPKALVDAYVLILCSVYHTRKSSLRGQRSRTGYVSCIVAIW